MSLGLLRVRCVSTAGLEYSVLSGLLRVQCVIRASISVASDTDTTELMFLYRISYQVL